MFGGLAFLRAMSQMGTKLSDNLSYMYKSVKLYLNKADVRRLEILNSARVIILSKKQQFLDRDNNKCGQKEIEQLFCKRLKMTYCE